MSKENIYIEPEDDITDIITKIENSKSKIIALIPPKKAGVFRSVVNMKLIAKAGKSAEKSIVLVTTDPSITKLAGASKLPVAKNLQTAPVIPKIDTKIEESSEEAVDEDAKAAEGTKEEPEEKNEKVEEAEETDNPQEDDEEDDESEDNNEEDKKSKKAKKSKNKFIDWIKNHRTLAIILGLGIIALILFLIWALFIAPSVDVFVSIKTDTNNFSEAITFVDKQSEENADEGKIFLEERKIETVNEVTFEATGQKNRGERATGEVVVVAYFTYNKQASIAINAGEKFTISGLSYAANKADSLYYNGDGEAQCENKGKYEELVTLGCRRSATIPVTAVEPGEKYNISASTTGWDTTANVNVYSDKAMSGGTDDVVTVVQQIDIEKAKAELTSANEEENKAKLYESISDDNMILESTFSQSTSAASATPAVDEEVKEGEKPTIKTTTTTSVFILDKAKLEDLIRAKVKLGEDKKIYEIRNVYIDGLRDSESGFTGKLKAVYFTGPKLTEAELVEKIKGKGLGDARREINDIEGVAEVKMDPSYPWVFKVPTDSNRITVSFEIKDQNGGAINEKTEESTDNKKSDSNNSDSKE